MYYKVLKDGKVIDVLDRLVFVKYQAKHDIMVACVESEAQAIMSSNGEYFWHVRGLYGIPVSGYDEVEIEQIDVYEYKHLKMLNCMSVQQIVDEYTLTLLEEGLL